MKQAAKGKVDVRGSTIKLKADGPDEREALDAIEKLIDAKFDEAE